MKCNEKALLGLSCFFGGVVVGFLISPMKKGLSIRNCCGNTVKSVDELSELTKESTLGEESEEVEVEETIEEEPVVEEITEV